jgi:hypothetical protein
VLHSAESIYSLALVEAERWPVFRLRPGGVFAGSDSTASFLFRLAHLGDTMVLVDPDRFASRLQAAGFTDARVRRSNGVFGFWATRPHTPPGP